MTRDDIIRMAREAQLSYGSDESPLLSVERFAALVSAAEREKFKVHAAALVRDARHDATEREREACAKVCESERERLFEWGRGLQVLTADKLAIAIRARGEK